ncbi:hypothetical protein [Mesonia maritima]|uniref:Membrane metalloprotease n=1 Tax=Mesonia maritima TaxID=1793873 RepID=A0ABU1K837_9FLAO|nr:hypothetical protein [Mesonia maritima]MDR6301197.1 hypothetical protein [Mesonia maritima]
MKQIKYTFYLLSLILFIGCSSDDSGDSSGIPDNDLGLGQSAHDLLANDIFSTMEIEVVYPEGFQPENESLQNLKSFLQQRTYKTSIDINTREIELNSEGPYSIEQIRSIENNVRTSFNTEDKISVFIIFANGKKQGDEGTSNTLGTAYQNTSIVIFQETIISFTNAPGAPSKTSIETTTLTHEFGHLLGLVGIGSEQQNEHEDPNAEAHCITENCLMRAEAEFSSGIMGMFGDNIPDLGSECILDLQANGGR